MTPARSVLGAAAGVLLGGCALLALPLTDAQRIWCDDHVREVRSVGSTLGILHWSSSERPTPDEAQAWDRSCRAAYDIALRRP